MTARSTMRGVQLTRHGGLDKLNDCDAIPVPESGPDNELIRVGAAGVNSTDVSTRIRYMMR